MLYQHAFRDEALKTCPIHFYTLSNNSDVEGQYVHDYVQYVISIHSIVSLRRTRRFKGNA
jgi:hypothetical protein